MKFRSVPDIKPLWDYVIIIVVACVTFQVLITAPSDVCVGGDFLSYYSYHAEFLRESVFKYHQLPLWDPYRFSGTPHIANPESSVFYVSTILILLSPNGILGIRYAILLHVVLSGICTYYLMITLGLNRRTALLSGVGYMLSGPTFQFVAGGYLNRICSQPWIPLATAILVKALSTRRLRYAFLGGVPLAMQVLAGSFISFFYTVIFLLLMVIYDIVYSVLKESWSVNSLKSLVKHISKIFIPLLSLTTCLALSSIKMIPLFEFLPNTYRSTAYTLEQAYHHYVHNFRILFTVLFAKDSLYNSINPFTGAPYNPIEYCAYVGALVAGLAIIAVLLRRNKHTIFFALSSIVFSLISLGPSSPVNVYALLYNYFPFFKTQHGGVRSLLIVSFSLIILAGFGVDELSWRLRSKISLKRRTACFVIVLILIVMDLSSFAFLSVNSNARVSLASRDKVYTSISPNDPGGVLLEYPRTIVVGKGAGFEATFTIKNIGDTIWLSDSHQPYKKGTVYFEVYIDNVGVAFKLPKDIYPEEVCIIRTSLVAPNTPGQYYLKVHLYDAGVGWFNDLNYFNVTEVRVATSATTKIKVQVSNKPIVLSNNVRTILSYLIHQNSRNTYDVRVYPLYMWYLPHVYLLYKNYYSSWGIEPGTWLSYYDEYLSVALNVAPGDISWVSYQRGPKHMAKLLGLLNIKYIVPAGEFEAENIVHIENVPYIYENKEVMPRVFCVAHAILIIGKNSTDEFNVKFITNLIKMPSFDPKKVVVINGNSSYIDDYDSTFLRRFDAIILLNSLAHNFTRARKLLTDYARNGNGIVFSTEDFRQRNTTQGLISTVTVYDVNNIDSFLSKLVKEPNAEANILNYTSNRIVVHVRSNNSHMFLVASEVYYPGWKAYLNGEETPIMIANSILRSIYLDRPGEYEVTFDYLPSSFLVGYFISGISILSLLFLNFNIPKKLMHFSRRFYEINRFKRRS